MGIHKKTGPNVQGKAAPKKMIEKPQRHDGKGVEKASKGNGGKSKGKGSRLERRCLDDGVPWNGTVEVFNSEKGFGFILPDDAVDLTQVPEATANNGKVFFVRQDAATLSTDFYPGLRVTYSLYVDAKGLGATKVMPLGVSGDQNFEIPKAMCGIDKSHLQKMKQGDVMIRVRISRDFVGILIGKGGEHVKSMAKLTGAQFHFEEWNMDPANDEPELFTCPPETGRWAKQPPYKLVIVTGSPEQVAAGLAVVAARMAEYAQSKYEKLVVVVPDVLMGKLIGKKGENIKKIRGSDPQMKINCSEQLTNGEEQMCLVTLFGPSGVLGESLARLTQMLSEEWQNDMERMIEAEMRSFQQPMYNMHSNMGGVSDMGGMRGMSSMGGMGGRHMSSHDQMSGYGSMYGNIHMIGRPGRGTTRAPVVVHR